MNKSLSQNSTRTCDHVVHRAHFGQHLMDEAHLGARLQVVDTLPQDGGEHAPDFRLAAGVAVLQQPQHTAEALGVLDDEVCLQIKLATHQLQEKDGADGKCEERLDFLRLSLSPFCSSNFGVLLIEILHSEVTWIRPNVQPAHFCSGFQPCSRSAFSSEEKKLTK